MKIKFFFIIWCLSLLTVLEAQGENVTFRVRSWDAVNKQVVTTTDTKDATVLSGEHENDRIALGNGYYVVNSHTQYKVLNITGNDVHLILSNGAELNCVHVKLKDGYKLHIHDVSDQSSGKLIVENHKEYTKKAGKRKYGNGSYTTTHGVYHTAAGIGSSEDGPMGSLYVHSGTVKVYQGGLGAAIGGGLEWGIGINNEVTIFGGIVETHVFSDNYSGAGIGGGMKANQGGPINIYGGTVVSMIDGDWQSCSHGAGIGGGGWDGNGGTVNIWGGHVIAIGGKDGCGIGGADGGKGGDVHIYGGTVEARGGEKCSAIGGYRGEDKGTISFADNLKVTGGTANRQSNGNSNLNATPERVFTNAEREAACQYRTWVKVEACPHEAPGDGNGSDHTAAIYYTIDDDTHHTKHCRYCNATWKENHSGETCVCGKFSIVQIGIHNPGTTENTYADGILKIVGAGKQFTMPACSVPEGYEFKGWEKDPTEENKNKWCHTPDGLVQPQTSITAEAGMGYAQYYARFAKVYTTSWTWIRTAGGVQATVTIQHKGETVASETSGPSNLNMGITCEDLTEAMTVEYDDKPAEEIDFVIGKRYNATCNYTNADGHNYVFTDSYDVIDDLTLQNGSDNTDNISDNILFPVNVAIEGRTLYKDGKWNTLCLPFDIYDFTGTPLEGATVMTLDVEDTYGDKKTGYDASTGTLSLYFEETDWIEAGVPYLVKWASGDNIESPVFNNFTIFNDDPDETKLVSEDGKVSFVGNYDPVVLTGGDKGSLYLGANNKLYWPSANKTVNAFRAIFKVDTSIASQVRSFEMNFDGDTVTGIVTIEQEKGNNRANRWYDLQGRQISNSKLSKGLYIHNGQVVVVK